MKINVCFTVLPFDNEIKIYFFQLAGKKVLILSLRLCIPFFLLQVIGYHAIIDKFPKS